MIEAGDLDRRITVERATTTTDLFGSEVRVWEPLSEVWASVEYVRDGEKFAAGETAASVDIRFRIRWGLGVEVTDRVTFEGRTFEVVGVKELGRREGQELSTVARAE